MPLPLFYAWQTSSDLRHGLYIYWIHILAMVYIYIYIYIRDWIYENRPYRHKK